MDQRFDSGSAWRVHFEKRGPAGVPGRPVPGRRDVVAIVDAIPAHALPGGPAEQPPGSALYVLHVPGGAQTPPDALQHAEAWVTGKGLAESEPVAELLLASDRVLWRPGCALIVGSGPLENYLPGLLGFACCEGELRRIESEVEEWWPRAGHDLHLTHQVKRASLADWPRVNEMTRAIGAARLQLGVIDGLLERPNRLMPTPSQRLAAELAAHADTASRLEHAAERLELLSGVYETANDRLSEYRYFRTEALLEWLIIAVLAVEALAVLVELR